MSDVPAPTLTDPAGNEHALTGQEIRIGRGVANDIVITSNRVSREHARVLRDGWKAILEDLGSTNGTLLNDERIYDARQLRDADRIQIGDVVFIFHDPEKTVQDSPLPVLEIDQNQATVRVDRQLVSLAPKEYALLAFLFENGTNVCSKDAIGAAVWPEYVDGVYDYQVENLVRRVRAKIEPDPSQPQLLLTVRGLGYRLIVR